MGKKFLIKYEGYWCHQYFLYVPIFPGLKKPRKKYDIFYDSCENSRPSENHLEHLARDALKKSWLPGSFKSSDATFKFE